MDESKYGLPPKIWLEMAIHVLGLSNYSPRTQLETIIENINQHGLRVKIDRSTIRELRLQPTRYGYEAVKDHDGEVTEILSAGPAASVSEAKSDPILVKALQFNFTSLRIALVELAGEEMYLVDETDLFVINPFTDLNYLYIDRDDLMNFRPKTTPAYADPKSKYYAPKLMLALRLHEDLRIKNSVPHFSNLDDRVNYMMQKFYRAHGKISSASGRLATVIGDGKQLLYSIPL